MLQGKNIIIGVTGSIAAYKAASLVSMLVKQHAGVTVIMTENATRFISPMTFETLTGKKCLVDTFDRNFEFSVEHVSVSKSADVAMIAPATANVIAKLAHGLADDMLSTTLLACRCPVMVAPAMNTAMYENPVFRDNLNKLIKYGYKIIEPASGYLACGDIGAGKLPEPEELFSCIVDELTRKNDLASRKVLITAGPTREAIDPVRFITNHSTGKMGYALAAEAVARGAEVCLVSGPVELKPPKGAGRISVVSAAQMSEAVKERAGENDIIICCAAVADMRPVSVSGEKLKKADMGGELALEPTEDILAWLGKNRKDGQVLVGFSMETENMVVNSREKLVRKNADMIVANNVKTEGAGFATDTNVVTLITKSDIDNLPIMDKREVAGRIFDRIVKGL